MTSAGRASGRCKEPGDERASSPVTGRRAALVAAVVLGAALVLVIALADAVGGAARAAGWTHPDRSHRRALRAEQVARAESFAAALRPASLARRCCSG